MVNTSNPIRNPALDANADALDVDTATETETSIDLIQVRQMGLKGGDCEVKDKNAIYPRFPFFFSSSSIVLLRGLSCVAARIERSLRCWYACSPEMS